MRKIIAIFLGKRNAFQSNLFVCAHEIKKLVLRQVGRLFDSLSNRISTFLFSMRFECSLNSFSWVPPLNWPRDFDLHDDQLKAVTLFQKKHDFSDSCSFFFDQVIRFLFATTCAENAWARTKHWKKDFAIRSLKKTSMKLTARNSASVHLTVFESVQAMPSFVVIELKIV